MEELSLINKFRINALKAKYPRMPPPPDGDQLLFLINLKQWWCWHGDAQEIPTHWAHNEPLCPTAHLMPLLHTVGLKQNHLSKCSQECSLDGMEFFFIIIISPFHVTECWDQQYKVSSKIIQQIHKEGVHEQLQNNCLGTTCSSESL